MQYRKTFQGAHEFSARDKNGNIFKMQYMFCTKREAMSDFSQALRDHNSTI